MLFSTPSQHLPESVARLMGLRRAIGDTVLQSHVARHAVSSRVHPQKTKRAKGYYWRGSVHSRGERSGGNPDPLVFRDVSNILNSKV